MRASISDMANRFAMPAGRTPQQQAGARGGSPTPQPTQQPPQMPWLGFGQPHPQQPSQVPPQQQQNWLSGAANNIWRTLMGFNNSVSSSGQQLPGGQLGAPGMVQQPYSTMPGNPFYNFQNNAWWMQPRNEASVPNFNLGTYPYPLYSRATNQQPNSPMKSLAPLPPDQANYLWFDPGVNPMTDLIQQERVFNSLPQNYLQMLGGLTNPDVTPPVPPGGGNNYYYPPYGGGGQSYYAPTYVYGGGGGGNSRANGPLINWSI